jgi:hypothetical protein
MKKSEAKKAKNKVVTKESKATGPMKKLSAADLKEIHGGHYCTTHKCTK